MEQHISSLPGNNNFRTVFSETIFNNKYRHESCETWEKLAQVLVNDVCSGLLPKDIIQQLIKMITEMKFIPGGRYLYYAGREKKFFNNCYLLKCESDTREDWADLSWKAESCLMTGGGIGIDYSVYRSEGSPIISTGGIASGPISKMIMINEIGRQVMQGGSRRSAIYASLNWLHSDAKKLLKIKNWYNIKVPGYDEKGKQLSIGRLKELDFNYPAPLDHTNISLNYDNKFLFDIYNTDIIREDKFTKSILVDGLTMNKLPTTFIQNCRQAMKTGEPGFSFNFGSKESETLRNACTEVTSSDDSDVCNLGSVNMGRISNIEEFKEVVALSSLFLLCGTLRATLPYEKVYKVREKNRRLGLGLMGIHEWLLQRGYRYEVGEELHKWLAIYRDESERLVNEYANKFSISRPVAYRAIAPTGTIGILADTTTGIEPLFAVAYKRRYYKGGKWCYQHVIDNTAKHLIEHYGVNPDNIETALDLSKDYERRIKFQADIQDYVDMSISSTINLPQWGTKLNNEDRVESFAETLARYAHRLRGFTCYPDGARGGQPLTSIPYREAINTVGEEYVEESNDICSISGKGGVCGE